jgi:hypothetical protein
MSVAYINDIEARNVPDRGDRSALRFVILAQGKHQNGDKFSTRSDGSQHLKLCRTDVSLHLLLNHSAPCSADDHHPVSSPKEMSNDK